VWFLYGTPQRVRLLVAQTPRLEVDEAFIFKKLAAAGTRIEEVSVDGKRGFFLSGSPHLVLLVDEHGDVVEESVRLARSVLVWEADGVAFRVEGDLSRDEALTVARALR
jgi:anti-sigma factor RsiW